MGFLFIVVPLFLLPLLAFWICLFVLYRLGENPSFLFILAVIWVIGFIAFLFIRGLFFPFVAWQGILATIAAIKLKIELL